MKPFLDSDSRKWQKISRSTSGTKFSTLSTELYELRLALRNLGAEICKERATFYVIALFITVFQFGILIGEQL